MPLNVPDTSLMRILDMFTASWGNLLIMELYQSDVTPGPTVPVSAYQPADFGGYVGGLFINGWRPSVMKGPRATAYANQLSWAHDGGASVNLIYGYFVVDQSGELVFAERQIDGPTWLTGLGQVYRVTPTFTLRSEY